MRALVMAGGKGERLQPLTANLPKPLLPVGGRPILDHVLLRLQHYGVDHVTLAVAHLATMIEEYCGTSIHGMRVSYLHEKEPLGTAGAIAMMPDVDGPFFMMNGDVLTDIDLSVMLAQHRDQNAILSVATKCMYTDLTLGVLDVNEAKCVTAYREKPRLEHRFGLGIYVIDPAVKAFMTPNGRIDMPDLINQMLGRGKTVAAYDHRGKWTDIGTPAEYNKAVAECPGLAMEAAAAADTRQRS